MNRDGIVRFAGAVLLGWMLLAQAHAQADAPPPPNTPVYSAGQLDQMLAPVALYPDDLLGQILMASTYPLEVVQADRWLQDSSNASLRGDQLTQALQQLPWDASVKSLVPFPQILSMMDSNLDWTEQLGDAFLARQNDVMDSVQRLRGRAQAAGTLASTPQETVANTDQSIQIAPADPGVVYVPVYNPQVAYGDWQYSDYPPYDFFVPGYAVGTFIAFSILTPYWGWDHWDWRHHHLDIDDQPGGRRGDFHPSPIRPVPWHHDPSHRGGVPYRDPGTRVRFEGDADRHSTRGNFRGYAPTGAEPAPSRRPPTRPPSAGLPQTARGQAFAPPVAQPEPARRAPPMAERPVPRAIERPAPQVIERPAPRVIERPVPRVIERPAPPALESFGHGPQVHVQEQRGFASRTAAPAPAPAQA